MVLTGKKKPSFERSAGIKEFDLIRRWTADLSCSSLVHTGVGDDAAVLHYRKDEFLLLAADMLIEGRHFLKTDRPQRIGHKALACNLSDIAAMGGRPVAALVSLALPPECVDATGSGIMKGIKALARTFQVDIVGGDTVASDQIVVSVSVMGKVSRKHLTPRRGSGAGDVIFVSGKLGGSFASGRHLSFTPRLREAAYLVARYRPTSMIDISDGLVADLHHLLISDGLGASLDANAIPRHRGVALENALYDGEDFELLFTLSPSQADRLERNGRCPHQFIRIGKIQTNPCGVFLEGQHKQRRLAPQKGFHHF